MSLEASLDPTGKLVFTKDTKGNCLPDFSHVGYHSGEGAIPYVPVKMTFEPSPGDDTQRIQNALYELGTLPLGKAGLRGALLLKRGVYRIQGSSSFPTAVLCFEAKATAWTVPSSLPPVTTMRDTAGL